MSGRSSVPRVLLGISKLKLWCRRIEGANKRFVQICDLMLPFKRTKELLLSITFSLFVDFS